MEGSSHDRHSKVWKLDDWLWSRRQWNLGGKSPDYCGDHDCCKPVIDFDFHDTVEFVRLLL